MSPRRKVDFGYKKEGRSGRLWPTAYIGQAWICWPRLLSEQIRVLGEKFDRLAAQLTPTEAEQAREPGREDEKRRQARAQAEQSQGPRVKGEKGRR